MTLTRACRPNPAGGRRPGPLNAFPALLVAGGMLLLAGCAGTTGASSTAQNALPAASVAKQNEVGAVSAALGNRLDQMLAQQVALTTR